MLRTLDHGALPRSMDTTSPSSASETQCLVAGGQTGHPKHERTPFTPDQLDRAWEYTLDSCPDCGGDLKSAQKESRVVQQVKLVGKPVRIEEHRGLAFWCPRCSC